jgi:hypothetical protein
MAMNSQTLRKIRNLCAVGLIREFPAGMPHFALPAGASAKELKELWHRPRQQPLDGGEGSGLTSELAPRIRLSDPFSLTPAVFWHTLRSPQANDSTSLRF